MNKSLQEVILKTLFYADVFDYPLTLEEINLYLLSNKPYSVTASDIQKLSKVIVRSDGYFSLKKRIEIITIRKSRLKDNKKKWERAKRAGKWLKLIPTICAVYVTGALSMNNAKKDDDIDILIVASSNFLWTSRFLVTILFSLLNIRRKPQEKIISNKVCFNMFMDRSHLHIPKNEQDLFAAHELVQMKLVWERGNTTALVYFQNQWIGIYLANFFQQNKILFNFGNNNRNLFSLSLLFYPLEIVLRSFQLWYMKDKRTNEVISHGYVRFHPKDARGWILKEYQNRLRMYGIE